MSFETFFLEDILEGDSEALGVYKYNRLRHLNSLKYRRYKIRLCAFCTFVKELGDMVQIESRSLLDDHFLGVFDEVGHLFFDEIWVSSRKENQLNLRLRVLDHFHDIVCVLGL